MEHVDVKQCPFCGATHMYVKPDEYGDGMFGIDGAHKLGCIIGNIDNCDYGEPEKAIAAWNTRATEADLTALLEQAREALGEIADMSQRKHTSKAGIRAKARTTLVAINDKLGRG